MYFTGTQSMLWFWQFTTQTLLIQYIHPSYFLVVHCFYCSCLSCKTHVPLFCSVQGFLWAAAVPETISSFLIARKQISPSNFSHLIVFSVDHLEVLFINNGKRKVEWTTTENEVLILTVKDESPSLSHRGNGLEAGNVHLSSAWQKRAALPQVSSLTLGLGQCPLHHHCSVNSPL